MKRKIVSFILALSMLVSIFALLPVASAAEGEIKLAGTDVTLTDGILLNFYIEADESLGVTNAELVEREGNKCYKITKELAAKEMLDEVSVQFMNGETPVGEEFTSSVFAYAAKILGGEYNDETKALVNAMINYGAAAQNFFEYNDDSVVGEPVTDTSALEAAEVADAVIEGEDFFGASLVLEGKMRLRFYFAGNDLDVTVDGAKTAVTNVGPLCYAEVSVLPHKLDTVHEVVAGDSTVKYSALNYLKNNVDNEELSEMVASIYAYGVAAEAYVNLNKTPLEWLQDEKITVYEYPMEAIEPVHGTVGYSAAAPGVYVADYTDDEGVDYYAAFIEITDTTFDSVSFKISQSSKDHEDPWVCFAFLTDLPTNDERVPFASGYGMCRNSTKDITVDIPEDAKYLYFYYAYGDCVYMPDSVVFTKGKTTLENIQDETLTEYSYPMDHIAADMAVIEYYGKEPSHKFKVDGQYFVTIIDITKCAFDYVSFGKATANTNWVIWTFLKEYPDYGEKVSYAGDYTTLLENEGAKSNVAIPGDANYLVVYHSEDYTRFYYPQSITFHDTKK